MVYPTRRRGKPARRTVMTGPRAHRPTPTVSRMAPPRFAGERVRRRERTTLRTTTLALVALSALLAHPALAQQNPAQGQSSMSRPPELNPSTGPDATATPSPAPGEGDKNPAAASASGCGTTSDKLEQTPVYSTPCPAAGSDPTPGSGTKK